MKKVLIDTSVWISHWKKEDKVLSQLLRDGRVVLHDFVEGEIACGNAALQSAFLGPFRFLVRIPCGKHSDVLSFISSHKLRSIGIWYVDVNLVYSCMISGCEIYTHDKNLLKIAKHLDIHFENE